MQDFQHFSHDDDERMIDETTLALQLLSAPQELEPELSTAGVVFCVMGAIFSAAMVLATFRTLWTWLDWSNLLLLLLQLVLVVGIWITLLVFCGVKLVMNYHAKQRNLDILEDRQDLQQQWFNELLQSKRDARERKNKALDTELMLRMTYIPPGPDGNYAAIRDPHTGQVLVLPPGNFQQPVPHTFHYHQVVPGVKAITEDDPLGLPAPMYPPARDFAEVLRSFQPSPKQIYLAETMERAVTSDMYELTHVGLGGKTGGGKTNMTRLLTSQLCYVEASVYLATPNFAQVKLNGHRLEDWRPIVAKLAAPPAQTTEEIAGLLAGFWQTFENRKAQEKITPRRQRDIYLVLGELPGIAKRMDQWYKEQKRLAELARRQGRDAAMPLHPMEIVVMLLREARQYGVHIITEFQDALVNSIGMDSGARENLLTGVYYGGDLITAKLLLRLEKGEKIDERGIGVEGAAYIRTKRTPTQPARIPFFSNAALYQLLGTPPDPMTDEEVFDEDEIPETYYRVDEQGRYVESTVLKTDPDEDECESDGTPTRSSFYPMPEPPPNPRRVVESGANQAPTEPRTGPLTTPVNRLPEQTGRIAQTVPAAQEVEDDGPELGPGDRMFTPEQEREFLLRYRRNAQQGIRDIKTTLRQMNHGEGLGNSYFRHASWLVKKHGLREA